MKINGSENTFANLPPSISLQYRTQTQYAACISEFQRKSQNTMKVLTRSLILQWYKLETLLVLSRFKKKILHSILQRKATSSSATILLSKRLQLCLDLVLKAVLPLPNILDVLLQVFQDVPLSLVLQTLGPGPHFPGVPLTVPLGLLQVGLFLVFW